MKANCYGIELYKLTTPDSYVMSIKVYVVAEEPVGDLAVSGQVVMDIAEPYIGEGRTIFGDNYYSSLPLVEALASRSTFYCGTIRKDRKFLPSVVTRAVLKKRQVVGRQCQHGVKLLNWMDKRNAMMSSSIPEHDFVLRPSRNPRAPLKPNAVLDYNFAKKGLDVNDQMSSYQDVNRKHLKWYLKLALDLLCNTLTVNVCVLQRHDNRALS